MADYNDVMTALRAADAAGNVEDATRLAEIAQSLKGTVTVSAPPVDDFASNEGGAAFGRPRRGQAIVQGTKPLESLGIGFTKSVVDPFVGAAQFVTGGNLGTSELAQRLGQEADYHFEENPAWYGTGRVGGMLVPATAGSKVLGVLPSFERLAGTAGNLIKSSALGAGSAALTPEETGLKNGEYYQNQAGNAILGGVAAPIVGKLAQGATYIPNLAKRLVEPFYEAGKDKVVGRALLEASGGEAEKAMQNIRDYIPSIKGAQPTTAEVAKVPSLAALERSAIATNPEVGNLLHERGLARNLLRKDFLENLTGANGQKEALMNMRELTAENNYLKAFTQKMNFKDVPKELLAQKDELLKSPAIQQAVKDASTNLANFGQKNINPTQSIQGLHEIKLALDDQIAKLTKPDMKQSEIRKIAGIEEAKQRLLSFLESDEVSPAYKKAREVYAAQSKPINQLEAAEKIAEKVINPNTDAIYPNQLARQLKTAEKGKTLNQRQLEGLKALQEDISGEQFAKGAGKATGSDTAQKLAYANMTNQMGIPNWLSNSNIAQGLTSILGQAGNMAYSSANERLASKLAHAITDPKESLRLMETAKAAGEKLVKLSPENKRLIELLSGQVSGILNPYKAKEGEM